MERDGQKEMSKGSKAKAEMRHTKMKGFKREGFFKGSSQYVVQRLTPALEPVLPLGGKGGG